MKKNPTEVQRKLEALKICLAELKRERIEAAINFAENPTPENREVVAIIHSAIQAVFAATEDYWRQYPAKAQFGHYRVNP